MHVVSERNGLPMGASVSAGQDHELRHATTLLDGIRVRRRGPGRPRSRPEALAADRAYSAGSFYDYLRRRGIKQVIPERRLPSGRKRKAPPRKLDQERYRRRNVVERLVGWLKERRRLSTRYEKLAQKFLTMIKIAFIVRYLHVLSDTA